MLCRGQEMLVEMQSGNSMEGRIRFHRQCSETIAITSAVATGTLGQVTGTVRLYSSSYTSMRRLRVFYDFRVKPGFHYPSWPVNSASGHRALLHWAEPKLMTVGLRFSTASADR